MYVYFAIVSFIMGAALGSFFNVCIYRIPNNKPVNNSTKAYLGLIFCPQYLHLPLNKVQLNIGTKSNGFNLVLQL